VYSREINDQEFTFGVSGKLIRNVLVMYDRQTNSLWSQLLGEAVDGPMEGTKLEYLASWQTTWEDWKYQHPNSLALRKGRYGDYDPYESYYNSGVAGVVGETFTDDRLYTKEFVIGVENNEDAVAFPFSVLNDQPVVNANVGDTNILVVFNSETGTGVVFDRTVDDLTLTFSIESDLTLIDQETGSRWDGMSGASIDGPLIGENLTRIKSTASFWFGWKDWFPNTKIYGFDE
jgi:hypothetical protein